jgi:hypothetical protein
MTSMTFGMAKCHHTKHQPIAAAQQTHFASKYCLMPSIISRTTQTVANLYARREQNQGCNREESGGRGRKETASWQINQKAWIHSNSGRGETIRTSDHLIPNQVRYQAALRPERQA